MNRIIIFQVRKRRLTEVISLAYGHMIQFPSSDVLRLTAGTEVCAALATVRGMADSRLDLGPRIPHVISGQWLSSIISH